MTERFLRNAARRESSRRGGEAGAFRRRLFDRSLFGQFIELLRGRSVVGETTDGKLSYDAETLQSIARDAQFVLHEQIRNSILQVVHR